LPGRWPPARIDELLSISSSIADGPGAAAAEGAPRVEFDGVDFAYTPGRNALTGVSFRAMPGQMIGVIGGTGAGKSTLAALIPRLYDVTAGRVAVDGADVRDYTLDALRERIGLVPQNAALFSGSIRDTWPGAARTPTTRPCGARSKPPRPRNSCAPCPAGWTAPWSRAASTSPAGSVSGDHRPGAGEAAGHPDPGRQRLRAGLPHRREAARGPSGGHPRHDGRRHLPAGGGGAERTDRILVLEDGRLAAQGGHDELYRDCEAYRAICDSQDAGEVAR
jgi:ATP-binding cassette subfamily B protein